jgi:heme exporter protein A
MLTVQNLSCRRGGRTVFRDVGFAVESGGFLRVAGPNGSGKSSLLRVLAGLVEPAAGTVRWQRAEIAADAAAHRARLHYIGHLDAAKPSLTVRETLAYWRALRGAQGDVAVCLDAFALAPLADLLVRRLSAGQRRRLSLTRLVLDAAPLWLLDEPATALDRDGQELLEALIARHRAAGGIVAIASHDEITAPGMQRFEMGKVA